MFQLTTRGRYVDLYIIFSGKSVAIILSNENAFIYPLRIDDRKITNIKVGELVQELNIF